MNILDVFERTVAAVLSKEPYYGFLLLNMKRHFNSKVPTAGVNVKDGHINLYINSDFFMGLTKEHRIGVLIHEIKHITHLHLLRRKDDTNPRDYNIAADAAINPSISQLKTYPTGCLLTGKQGKVMPESIAPNLLSNETAEYYLKYIQKQKKDKGDGTGDGVNDLDDHSVWEDGEGDAEAVKEVLKKQLKDAKDKAQSIGAGNVPGDAELALDALSKSLVTWKQALRMFFASISDCRKEKTRKRRNRRYGIAFPGKKKEPTTKLAIAIDTSGSVSDQELQQFFTEIRQLATLVDEMHIIQCDSAVTKVEPWNGKIPQVLGRGGTEFQPALDAATKLGVDGLIYFTDGDCYSEPTKPGYPVLWALVRGVNKPVSWGKHLHVTKQ